MAETKPIDLFTLVVQKHMTDEQAIAAARRVGCNVNELLALLGKPLETTQTVSDEEARSKKVWRVTAHMMPHKDPYGTEFRYGFAGRHRWPRMWTGQSDGVVATETHDLTETQFRDLDRKARKGVLVIHEKVRITDEEKSSPQQSAPAPQHQDQKRR